jgi:hypothetical protein
MFEEKKITEDTLEETDCFKDKKDDCSWKKDDCFKDKKKNIAFV